MIDTDARVIRNVVILTGAGISAESGLATFRDSGGLWEGHDPMEIATPEAFSRNPELVYRFYNARRQQMVDALPNDAHSALARLQQDYPGDVFLVTQNVDDLHTRAGSPQVCHMHGELMSVLCQQCEARTPWQRDCDQYTLCPGCKSSGRVRPDIVWFGEMPYCTDEIDRRLIQCDLFVAIGTSGVVYPAAGFVREARRGGAITVEINREPSEVANEFHQQRLGPATREVSALVEELLTA